MAHLTEPSLPDVIGRIQKLIEENELLAKEHSRHLKELLANTNKAIDDITASYSSEVSRYKFRMQRVETDNTKLKVQLSHANATIHDLRVILQGVEVGAQLARDKAELLEAAVAAERQTIAQRIDLALSGNAQSTDLEGMLNAVAVLRAERHRLDKQISEAVEGERQLIAKRLVQALKYQPTSIGLDRAIYEVEVILKSLQMWGSISAAQAIVNHIADALDAPGSERLPTNDDGTYNKALPDRLTDYYRQIYTALGFTGLCLRTRVLGLGYEAALRGGQGFEADRVGF